MGPESTDFIIYMSPPEKWRTVHNRDEMLAALEKQFGRFLGVTYEFSQPIEMRMNELIAGVRSDIAIQIFGDDMGILAKTGDQVVAAISQISGARGFRAQQVSGLPVMEVAVRPDEIAPYGINSADVMEVVEAIAGLETTQIIEG
jgi:heavy metal efflux system protein